MDPRLFFAESCSVVLHVSFQCQLKDTENYGQISEADQEVREIPRGLKFHAVSAESGGSASVDGAV